MNSVTENTINSSTYDYVDNTSISVESTKIDTSISNIVITNIDATTIKISDTDNKIPFLKTKQYILNLYIKFNKKQSKILKELNERKEGYTIIDFKLKLISDNEAIDLLTEMRLIANNNR